MVAQIPEHGLQLEFAADAATSAQLAAVGGLRTLTDTVAKVALVPERGGKVRVSGRVRAVVGQTCVVTLEPVQNVVDEAFSVLFLPEEEGAVSASAEEADDDPPEVILGGVIDVGSLATDYLFLGVDPYPRKAGVAFDPVEAALAPEDHPFAALKALREPAPGDGSEPKPPRGRAPGKGR
jgi:hypothetical protein